MTASSQTSTSRSRAFAAARVQHVEEVILPALEAGKVVVCDRFVDASYAYQGGGRQLGESVVKAVDKLVLDGCKPNLTLLFDLPVETGMTRVTDRGDADRFEVESLAFFQRVRNPLCKVFPIGK